MTTAIACPPKPPVPPATGITPTAKAMGTMIGAVTRSAGRTQSAVRALTGRNSTPYTISEPPRSSWSAQASRNMVRTAKSPAPIPVSRGSGNLRSARTTGGTPPGRDPRFGVAAGAGATTTDTGPPAGPSPRPPDGAADGACAGCLRCGVRVLCCSTPPT